MKRKKRNNELHELTRIKKNVFLFSLLPFLFSLFYLLSCNDPVFYEVSMQEKILPPRISGSPTDFVEINKIMYVASTEALNFYYTEWDPSLIENDPAYPREPWGFMNPGLGRITYLAGTASQLFALTNNGVYICTDLTTLSFTPLATPNNESYWFLSMYSANNEIFVCARRRYDSVYHIFHADIANAKLDLINLDYGISRFQFLRGVAFNGSSYFYCIKDNYYRHDGGIYAAPVSDPVNASLLQNNYGIAFMGIIRPGTGTSVYAIERNGLLFSVTDSEVNYTGYNLGRLSNGCLGVWTDGYVYMLLAGRQDTLEYNTSSGYTYGYMEAQINEEGEFIDSGIFREPGTHTPGTLAQGGGDYERFITTVGKYPIKYLYQAGNGIMFASSYQEGVWSLRDRHNDGNPHWNTEQ